MCSFWGFDDSGVSPDDPCGFWPLHRTIADEKSVVCQSIQAAQ